MVEVRISQFRAFLAILLAIFGVQNFFWAGTVMSETFFRLSLAACSLALAFSIFVLVSHHRKKDLRVTPLAIASIGIDAALVILPVGLFFSVPEIGAEPLPVGSQAILNQPSVFAMYLLVIASGLRFREVAKLGIVVNGSVIFGLMMIEAARVRLLDTYEPVAMLAIRQHILLLASSALLAWLISTHIRSTTLMAAQTALKASVDGLTGVYNRHHLRECLESLCRDKTRSLYLLMADVDHFKSINDRLGHSAGDHVLVEIARRMQNALRPEDTLARYGGEEFCVLLTDLDDPTATNVAERLRNEVAKSPIEELSVTISVGLSRWNGQEPIATLMERADTALYQAKNEGRNRVTTLWSQNSQQP